MTNQRKFLQNKGYVQLSQEERGKRSYLRESSAEKEKAGRQFYLDSYRKRLERKDKLDTGEVRMSQRIRTNQNTRRDCQR